MALEGPQMVMRRASIRLDALSIGRFSCGPDSYWMLLMNYASLGFVSDD